MRRHFRVHPASFLALAAATAFIAGCEPATQPIDGSQVRPAGSAPAQEPGSTVKFDANNAANPPAAGGGATTPK